MRQLVVINLFFIFQLFVAVKSKALFLTPYIENGDILIAQQLCEVKSFMGNIQSHSGYITVNKTYNSNLFFWFFEANNNYKKAPLVVWLQGGPGASSLFGLFTENGPYYIRKDNNQVDIRNYYWSELFNVIYVDNPVGTGFSFTDNNLGYARNEIDVGTNLEEFIHQFLLLFPELNNNELYITGESYAGKYVPAMAYFIHKSRKSQINLKGISIGNGLVDPINQMDYGQYLYEIGLIDYETKQTFIKIQQDIFIDIEKQDWTDAFYKFNKLILGDNTLFFNKTGFKSHYNFLNSKDDSIYGDFVSFLTTDTVREKIHVGSLPYNDNNELVEEYIKNDILQSTKPYLEVLLNNYKVLIYNGQLDIIVPFAMTTKYIRSLNWCGSLLYNNTERKIWKVKSDIAGYVKSIIDTTSCTNGGNLIEILVRNAGHMVPQDQPVWALDMISKFIFNKPF